MGTIFQIILTIIARNRGWRWLSLIPIAVGLVLGFLIGAIGISMGYSIEDLRWSIILDLLLYAVLIYMCLKPKQNNTEKLPEENNKQ